MNKEKKIDDEIDISALLNILSSSKKLIFIINLIVIASLIFLTTSLKENYEVSLDIMLGHYGQSKIQSLTEIQSELNYDENITYQTYGDSFVRIQTLNPSKEKGGSILKDAVKSIIFSSNRKINNLIEMDKSTFENIKTKINILSNEEERISNEISKINSSKKDFSSMDSLTMNTTLLDLKMRLADLDSVLESHKRKRSDPNYYQETLIIKDVYSRTIQSKRLVYIILGSIIGFIFSIFTALISYGLKNYKYKFK